MGIRLAAPILGPGRADACRSGHRHDRTAPPRSTTHGDFSINRIYDASPADVWAAWADGATKARWFIGPEGWQQVERTLDLRVGGTEILRGASRASGLETLFTARYHLVEAQARLVYVYDMHLSGKHHSVSVATVEFIGDPEGHAVALHRAGDFVDGTDGRDGTLSRKRGTSAQLERLASVL
jgi:uncharacterized protein YndB with AHSA1/START domain